MELITVYNHRSDYLLEDFPEAKNKVTKVSLLMHCKKVEILRANKIITCRPLTFLILYFYKEHDRKFTIYMIFPLGTKFCIKMLHSRSCSKNSKGGSEGLTEDREEKME